MPFPNPDQLAVIEAVRESLLVLSPMGTGKTRTAAAAIRRAIETGIEPEGVLGLTFTNRAAEAMRTAVAEALPNEGPRVQLFNLHGLCARLLREEGRLADLPPDFAIIDEDESKELLWQFVPRPDRDERYKNKPVEALNAYEKFVFDFLMGEGVGPVPDAFRMYRDALHRDGCVDFTGLIARAYRVLKVNAEARDRWQSRYAWILVDEAQDINLAEYRIIALLGAANRCLKFFGDTHQTIYEWRHAQPRQVIAAFDLEFQPRRLALRANYRCSKALVEASNALRRDFIPSQEPFPEAAGDQTDGAISLNAFETSEEENSAVVAQVAAWRRDGIPCAQIAVLARQNRTLAEISSVMKFAQIPHLVAEDFDFFRRQEVKDVVAMLEHLICPFRRHPVLRLLKRFGAKEGALDALEKAAQGSGLHVGYLARGAAGDPLQPLLEAWKNGRVVALDTESTGLDPATAEAIQLARVTRSDADCFCEWIRPSGKVGESVHVHGFTDEHLLAHGKDARDVLERGLRFERGEVLLGHNLEFDLRLLRSHAARLGLETRFPMRFDTMPLAAATLAREQITGLRLENVARSFAVEMPHAHDAQADSRACLAILERLMPQLMETQPTRMKIIAEMGSDLALAFRRVTTLFRRCAEKEAEGLPVSDLVPAAWKLLCELPGQHDYALNPARTKNIEDLAAIARFLERRRGGALSLFMFLEQVALSRRDMLLEADPDRVRLLTAHAAKGLEFEAVALPRLVAPWPCYSDEEARVFYVMLTRARRHVWMSWPRNITMPWGQTQRADPLKYIGVIKTISSSK
ncbi:MAG: UvrD-helicase domain-containing protein [Verrucomicrobia bacterium]|nr:UvrD-helicase domain-containing protein [Verrucomicrobiota bacterium]